MPHLRQGYVEGMTKEQSKFGGTPVTTVEELREIVPPPLETAANKVRPALHELDRQWLAASPLCLVATSDAEGNLDVSPKGDPAGSLVRVLDDRTIAIPERPGNRRTDGFLNVLANPHVGLIFVIPGRGDTLRVNGRARLVRDAPYLAELQVRRNVPVLALEVDVEEVFHHCSKAFLRSKTWDPETWGQDEVPRRAVISRTLERRNDSLEELDAYYGPRYAETIYG
ncbi:pyridoxamine 5'-phosphate oxidase family protein [Promicromonospora kroppenstedtii]|uniref:pyridoxamine 5'-phosphate oxidase family protein n=1 Tax=Promicromonospora kroppenstedtii TaxID=440482 RepID=UPI001FE14A29|nr:pyridoxamine 5'-phosphate oxidase family protein [Promicromonospora kroppenstedtii]